MEMVATTLVLLKERTPLSISSNRKQRDDEIKIKGGVAERRCGVPLQISSER
jgi:hypothetical protein